jgi:hypothetical protein
VESKKLPLPQHLHSNSTNSNSQKSAQSNQNLLGKEQKVISGRNDENLRQAHLQSVEMESKKGVPSFGSKSDQLGSEVGSEYGKVGSDLDLVNDELFNDNIFNKRSLAEETGLQENGWVDGGLR